MNSANSDRGGKYLTFALGTEEYGLPVLTVREIIAHMDVTPVPRLPAYVKGVINLRGRVIPVIDLRAKLGMSPIDRTDRTCIVVVEIQQQDRRLTTGVMVDRVLEVLNLTGEAIEPAPAFDASVRSEFILGLGKVGQKVKILLDIEKVLSTADVLSLANLTPSPAAAA